MCAGENVGIVNSTQTQSSPSGTQHHAATPGSLTSSGIGSCCCRQSTTVVSLVALGYSMLTDFCDLHMQQVVTDTYRATQASAAAAAQHNIPLIAYEGGQHMGGGGSICGSDACNNNDKLQQMFYAANRDPRIAGLYDNMFRWDMPRSLPQTQSDWHRLPSWLLHPNRPRMIQHPV